MQSDAPDVTTYLEEVPSERQASLRQLRALCQETLGGYQETMTYGMPGYQRPDGEIEVAFASQKNYISLYLLKQEVLEANRDALAGLSIGKGCIRYSSPKKMNFDVIRKMLEETVAWVDTPC